MEAAKNTFSPSNEFVFTELLDSCHFDVIACAEAPFGPLDNNVLGTSSEKKRYYVGIFPILGGGV